MALTKVGKEGITGIDNSSDATAITIDSSENFMVGTTDNQLFDNTSGGGLCYRPSLSLDIAREATSSSNSMLTLNNTGVDARFIEFRKDATTVGSIGVAASDNLYIAGGSGSTKGLYFNDTSILPATTGGGTADNAVDLGQANVRYKNLYLSGGAYIGGTGSANYLDDYEEGTAFVGIQDGSGNGYTFYEQNGQYNTLQYTKIGRLVFFTIMFYTNSTSGTTSSGHARVTGLPFTSTSAGPIGGAFIPISYAAMNTSNALVMGGHIETNSTVMKLYKQDTDGDYSTLTIAELGAYFGQFSGMYHSA